VLRDAWAAGLCNIACVQCLHGNAGRADPARCSPSETRLLWCCTVAVSVCSLLGTHVCFMLLDITRVVQWAFMA
jgi:hypothetical protein